MNNNIFQIKRLSGLLKRYYLLNSNTVYITVITIAGALFILFFLSAISNMRCSYDGQSGLFFPVFFIAGFIISNNAFSEIRNQGKGYQYLTLPVSNLERLLAGWLYSSVLYVIFGIVLFVVLSVLANLLASLVMGFDFFFFDLDMKNTITTIGIYMILQTIFLFGGAAFKKNSFLKTVLMLVIVSFGILLVISITGLVVFADVFSSFRYTDPGAMQFEDMENSFSFFPVVINILFRYILAPFILVVTYFKLKECEV